MDLIWLLAEKEQLEFFHSDAAPRLDNPNVKSVRWLPRKPFPPLFDFAVCDRSLEVPREYVKIASQRSGSEIFYLISKEGTKFSFPDVHEKILSAVSMWNQAVVNTEKISPNAWCTPCHKCGPNFSVLFSDTLTKCRHFSIQVGKSATSPAWAKFSYDLPTGKIFSKVPVSQWMQNANIAKAIQIKIVSLPSDSARRRPLKKYLADLGLQFSIFWGHDAGLDNYRECPPGIRENFHSPYGEESHLVTTVDNEVYLVPSGIRGSKAGLSRGEFGCALSHLKLYESIFVPTIIFEDDAKIDNPDLFFETVRNMPNPALWDVCYLQSASTWWPPSSGENLNDFFSVSDRSCNRTHAYAVTPSGAKILREYSDSFKKIIGGEELQTKIVALPSDDLIAHAQRDRKIKGIAPKIRCISPADGESTIQLTDKIFQTTQASQITMKNFGDKWTGVGNQMWQYAVLKVAALKSRSRLVLGPSKIDTDCSGTLFPRKNFIEIKEITEFTPISDLLNPSWTETTVNIQGYLQHEKYFEGYEDYVREILAFKGQTWEKSAAEINKLRMKTAKRIVAVHIRLKDFRNDPTEFLYNIWKPQKLQRVVEKISRDSFFLIFSNDMEECKKIFSEVFAATRCEWFDADPEIDMCLMSMCDDFIISASSFSWWAAYLADRGKVWIPQPWFNPKRKDLDGKDVSGLYLKGWQVIDN